MLINPRKHAFPTTRSRHEKEKTISSDNDLKIIAELENSNANGEARTVVEYEVKLLQEDEQDDTDDDSNGSL
jgi:hypothetical protein